MVSYVWKHFTKSENGQSAKCSKCNCILSCKGASTSALRNHLLKMHNLLDEVDEPPQKRLKQSTLSLKNKKTSGQVLAELAAKDGLTINQIRISECVSKGLKTFGYDMPKSGNTIMKEIALFGNTLIEEVVNQIKLEKLQGAKYSLSFDEWTSMKNRRYLNINLHKKSGDFVCLGLIRVFGSLTAAKTKFLILEKLDEFGVSLTDDVVSSMCDGAAVNISYCKNSGCEYQICLSHGIHLAVIDVLFKKKTFHSNSENSLSDSETSSTYNDLSNTSTIEDNCTDIDEDSDFLTTTSDHNQVFLSIRKIVKFFKSDLKNQVLQEFVVATFGHEINLKLDCKTRWNSLETMLSTFLKLFDCVKQALRKLKQQQLMTLIHKESIQEIATPLEIIKSATEMLCSRDITLSGANEVINVMLFELEKSSSKLSNDFYFSLKHRFETRLNPNLTKLDYLLSSPTADLNKVFFCSSITDDNIFDFAETL